jgi:hypothetical protein
VKLDHVAGRGSGGEISEDDHADGFGADLLDARRVICRPSVIPGHDQVKIDRVGHGGITCAIEMQLVTRATGGRTRLHLGL